MTDDAGVICRRCGFANVAGDQFCGSCGAFLEWEGETAAAPPVSADPGADDGLAGLVRPAGAASGAAAGVPPPTAWTPAPPAVAPVAPVPPPVGAAPAAAPAGSAPAAAAAGLLRCPGCGIANASTRTFCQSCGTRLAEAPRVAEVSREQIAAAVSARAAPVTAAPVKTARAEPSEGSSGGIAGWVIGVALVGIVVGIGIVAASVLLKSPGPTSGATAAPSALTSTGPGSSAAAVTTAPGATAAPASAGAATPAPTQKIAGVPLKLTGATASSVVGNLAKFQPGMAIDGDLKTSWQEGATNEKGQWIEVSFDPARVDAVVLNNGYGASSALYKGNLRLKKVGISVDGGTPTVVTLKDTGKDQLIVLGNNPGATKVRITIVSTYPSVKTSISGTPFDDAALSEIRVLGAPGG